MLPVTSYVNKHVRVDPDVADSDIRGLVLFMDEKNQRVQVRIPTRRPDGRKKYVQLGLAQVILGIAKTGKMVRFLDGDTLNCTRANMQVCGCAAIASGRVARQEAEHRARKALPGLYGNPLAISVP